MSQKRLRNSDRILEFYPFKSQREDVFLKSGGSYFLVPDKYDHRFQVPGFVRSRSAKGKSKLLLPQAAVQPLRLGLQDGRDWTASDRRQRIVEVPS